MFHYACNNSGPLHLSPFDSLRLLQDIARDNQLHFVAASFPGASAREEPPVYLKRHFPSPKEHGSPEQLHPAGNEGLHSAVWPSNQVELRPRLASKVA